MADNLDRMRSLLSSYYGLEEEESEDQTVTALNIDSSSFDVEQYMAVRAAAARRRGRG